MLKGQFAVEVCDLNSLLIFTELHQAFRNVNGFLPLTGCLIDLQQLLQRTHAEIGFIGKLIEHVFSAVIQTCGHVIATELLNRQQTLFVGQ
ncbi:hypothetical protein D3C73_1230800 [compost metagenome]